MQSGRQVYNGLAGLFLVSDDEESALKLPTGAQDIPLVIQDRSFDPNNQLVYAAGSAMDGSMDYLMGFLGERVLVNGRPEYTLDVATRAYRLRLLNGSNARTYKLGWDDGTPLTVIASDGGLLERPAERPYVMLSPGERIELWADFSSRPAGAELTLQSLVFAGAEGTDTPAHGRSHAGYGGNAMSGHHGHDMGGHDRGHQMGAMVGHTNAAPPLGAPMTVLTVRVTEQAEASDTLPGTLSTIERYRPADAVNCANPRTFTLTQPGMRWEINGRVYDMTHARVDETVKLGELEAWLYTAVMRLWH
jgi:FtsP/CotA-like multicopper oxidase with cupredoxin domain